MLAGDRKPDPAIWREPLLSSRLIEYETWVRVHARGLDRSHGDAARDLLSRISFVELSADVLRRAVEPFPTPLRTLDALHLASVEFLRGRGTKLRLATLDDRMRTAARALRIPTVG